MPIERSAGAVIFRKEKDTQKYLLLHYAGGHWDFPKGNIEKGEKSEEAAGREIFEETGIKDIEFVPGFKETVKYFYKRTPPKYDKDETGKTVLKTVVFFLTQTKTKKIKISWEHQGFKWLPYEEALEQLIFKNAKEILQKASDFISKKGI